LADKGDEFTFSDLERNSLEDPLVVVVIREVNVLEFDRLDRLQRSMTVFLASRVEFVEKDYRADKVRNPYL
jgi:hypothetical protein